MGERQDKQQVAAQMDQGGMAIRPTLFVSRPNLTPVFAIPDKIEPVFEQATAEDTPGFRGYASDFIEWRREPIYRTLGVDSDGVETRADARSCLWAFCDLHKANVNQIIRFTKRYGVLGVWPSVRTSRTSSGRLMWTYREPVAIWQDMAQWANAILRLMNLLYHQFDTRKEGERQRLEQWHKVFKLGQLVSWFIGQDYFPLAEVGVPAIYEKGKIPAWIKDIEIQKALLEHALSLWLGQLTVTPRLFCSGANANSPYWTFDVNCSPNAWDVDILTELGENGDITERLEYDAWDIVRLLELDDTGSVICRDDLEWNRFEDFDLRSPMLYRMRRFRPSRLFNVITLELAAVLSSRDIRRPCKRHGCNAFAPERTNEQVGRPPEYCSGECRDSDRKEKSRSRMQKSRSK